ncbi:MAG: hypothetical protein NT129_02300 [Candidatus Aenigmarchaeota archaeon]|nr:hypothetical protein [Candidatus Aenigmarchaeota archaeon]
MEIIEYQTIGNIAKAGVRTYAPGFLVKGAIRRPGHLSMSIYRCNSRIRIESREHVCFEGCRLSIEYFSPRYIEVIGSQENESIIGGKKRRAFDFHHTALGGELYIEKEPVCKEYDLIYEGGRGNFQIHADLKEKGSFIDKFFEEIVTKNKLTQKEKKYLSSEILRKLSEGVK